VRKKATAKKNSAKNLISANLNPAKNAARPKRMPAIAASAVKGKCLPAAAITDFSSTLKKAPGIGGFFYMFFPKGSFLPPPEKYGFRTLFLPL
jgi:hypothetical protein